MTYATITDVASELGRPITEATEINQVNAWLTRAELAIKARIPTLDTLVTLGQLTAEAIRTVEAAAVARKVLNPRGLRQRTVSVDDGSVAETTDSTQSDGVIRILPEEWALLIPPSPITSLRAARSPRLIHRHSWPLADPHDFV